MPIAIAPNSEALSIAYGVLKVTMGSDGYSLEFVSMVLGEFSDSGPGTCH